MTIFTIVDFKKGYWMVVLHPDSRKLTCMALLFQWTQLPMGTVVAQDIFQSKLDAIFIGMEGVTGIVNDMAIAGKDEMEHDKNFLAFMENVWKTTSLLTQRRYSSSRHRYLSMATAGQSMAFHQIQRKYRH